MAGQLIDIFFASLHIILDMDKLTDNINKDNWQQRTSLLLGDERMQKLRSSHVLVVGTGGVGGYAAEMICRAGIGHMTIVDADRISETNINRQIIALHSNIDKVKVEVMGQRLKDINPELDLTCINGFLSEENIPQLLDENHFDFIVDCIDTITPKLCLITSALDRKIKIISSMGAGAKTDISKIAVTDISKTFNCGLSKTVRKRLHAMGYKGCKFPAVFSAEPADMNAVIKVEGERNKKTTAGTISYMPAVFGCYLAEYVIKQL